MKKLYAFSRKIKAFFLHKATLIILGVLLFFGAGGYFGLIGRAELQGAYIMIGSMFIVLVLFMLLMGQTRANFLNLGKSRAIRSDRNVTETFKDVAGCPEAKDELAEFVELLIDPRRAVAVGGTIPRGILLVGDPGVGKTLLARAVAGEAGVPFWSVSGSDFVEMFVGVGAARVNDMFKDAKKEGGGVIFIDEIDAIGKSRGRSFNGSNDEQEATLNALLVQMDGFVKDPTVRVIVLAATNRPDVLDPALLRPGRFDRQVVVPLPDILGREQILKVHTRKVPLAHNVDLNAVARSTPGFSGAGLANLVNEAALFAARKKKACVDMDDIEDARDKVIMGSKQSSIVMSADERLSTAYHESGHAIVAKLIPGADPVHKVTIIPRGRSLGATMYIAERDQYSYDRDHLLTKIAVLLGGRVGEDLFAKPTTGAENDFSRANALARDMVTRWGMSELGQVTYQNDPQTFRNPYSEETMRMVDAEVRRIITEQFARARLLVEGNRDKAEKMARALLQYETIDASQVNDIMEGREVVISKKLQS